ncbi:hypothetical protein FRC04_003141 [Tulasnella sp. 424]|nr:hypothetical protein FRC04_003141 [Tulasnella sp. 424]
MSEDLREAMENFIRVLRDVEIKLDKLALKYGTCKRGMRERIKYFLAMLREHRCSQILQTCHVEVDLASKSIHDNLGDGPPEPLGSSPEVHLARPIESPAEASTAGEHSTTKEEPPELPLPSSGQKLIFSSGDVDPTEGLSLPQTEQVLSTAVLGASDGSPNNHLEDPKEHPERRLIDLKQWSMGRLSRQRETKRSL